MECLDRTADMYRWWFKARHSTQTEREMATFKLNIITDIAAKI